MRLMLTTAAALALGACCHSPRTAADAPAPAADPATAEETAVEPTEWQEPVMPTAEEAAKASADAQAAAEAGVVYVGEDKKGGAVMMKTGETLRIELGSIPTAGYVWTVAEAPAFMKQVAEGGRPTNPAYQNLPGYTGGNHYISFDFQPVEAGSGTFKLTEGRPWETDEDPMDTFELTVTVTE
ncbi:MAG: protease inhibitor I42 family protein [Hyphomonas sp.]|uniref:protease inhibitor I42 family protein n=1 Tax=Hyphomonas sp. TaxID=87 RepID=UPI00349FDEF7